MDLLNPEGMIADLFDLVTNAIYNAMKLETWDEFLRAIVNGGVANLVDEYHTLLEPIKAEFEKSSKTIL